MYCDDGARPLAGLVASPDGKWLYGTTSTGGSNNDGAVFVFRTSGSDAGCPPLANYQHLHDFSNSGGDGEYPVARLALSADGTMLYGTTLLGGANNSGTVFSIQLNYTANGSIPTVSPNGYKVISFPAPSTSAGAYPMGDLVLSPVPSGDIWLYGTASLGGMNGYGTVFAINTALSSGVVTLYNFTGSSNPQAPDSGYPAAGLLQWGTTFYGTTAGIPPNMNQFISPPSTIPGNAKTLSSGSVFAISVGYDLNGNPSANSGTLAWADSLSGPSYGDLCWMSLPGDGTGVLIGTIENGSEFFSGAVFAVGINGGGFYTTSIPGSCGAFPVAGLTSGQTPAALLGFNTLNFYGTTSGGWGDSSFSYLFELQFSGYFMPTIHIVRPGLQKHYVLSWTSSPGLLLQSAPGLHGPWTNIVGATSPYTNAATAAQQFFRVAGTPYVGNSLTVPNGGPDGTSPLVILGEYSPAGPLAGATPSTTLPTGTVQDVKFYGQNYDFTLYALSLVTSGPNTNEQTFQVVAEESFSGTNLTPGIQTLPVSGFTVTAGNLLAFAGIGPYYPQQTSDDATNSDATYEDSSNPGSFTATRPGDPGTEFIVGINPDTNADYEYIPNGYSNQGRSYAIGVDVSPASGGMATLATLGATARLEGPRAGSDSIVLGVNPATNTWTATANATWLHLSAANQSGSGSQNVVFSWDPNPGPTRTGTLTIAGQTLTVIQGGSKYVRAPGPLTTLASGLGLPEGLAVDGAGNVYIAEAGGGQPGIYEWTLASNAVTLRFGLDYPNSVAVDAAGNLYIPDTYSHSVYAVAPDGHLSATLLLPTPSDPDSVAVDGVGNVYIGDDGTQRVYEWTPASSNLTTLVSTGLNDPNGVAVDVAGNVYIADYFVNVVLEWSAANSNVTTLVAAPLNQPASVAVDGAGNAFIADSNGKIYEWVAASNSVITLISSGLNGPFGVAVDGADNLYVADTSDYAIKELPCAFVDPTAKLEGAAAGSDALPMVLPFTANLLPPFAPTSDQLWLTITGVTNGVVSFAFTATTTNRTAHITLLGQAISVTQSP